ncbi:MAG: citrate synthase [Polyangiales bacterium]
MSEVRATPKDHVYEGLEGVVVTATRLSHVDGEQGRLVIAGQDVERLAAHSDFESACALLWAASGEESTPARVRTRLAEGRAAAFARLPQLGDAFRRADGMDALRAALAHLDEQATPEVIVAAAAVFTAAFWRLRQGLAPIAPQPEQRHAEALLAMLGLPVDVARARALDAYLVTVTDHGLNASTFAARVVASTRSDLVSAVVAGVGALKGPLHGGAPGPVLEMLDAIGEPARARDYLTAELAAGRRIMGMGHRIYRQRDPRALVLERATSELEQALRTQPSSTRTDDSVRERLKLARAVEQSAEALLEAQHPGRRLKANVEFYTAVLLSALGISSPLFSALFACARSAGWIAHYREQQHHGRLIRPSSLYVGVLP